MISWMFGIIPEMIVGFALPVMYIMAGVATPQVAFRLGLLLMYLG